jgi:hypothetical protein
MTYIITEANQIGSIIYFGCCDLRHLYFWTESFVLLYLELDTRHVVPTDDSFSLQGIGEIVSAGNDYGFPDTQE